MPPVALSAVSMECIRVCAALSLAISHGLCEVKGAVIRNPTGMSHFISYPNESKG